MLFKIMIDLTSKMVHKLASSRLKASRSILFGALINRVKLFLVANMIYFWVSYSFYSSIFKFELILILDNDPVNFDLNF